MDLEFACTEDVLEEAPAPQPVEAPAPHPDAAPYADIDAAPPPIIGAKDSSASEAALWVDTKPLSEPLWVDTKPLSEPTRPLRANAPGDDVTLANSGSGNAATVPCESGVAPRIFEVEPTHIVEVDPKHVTVETDSEDDATADASAMPRMRVSEDLLD